MNLPDKLFDGIFSSHMLEHYQGRFEEVIGYWLTRLKPGGLIMLYLPNCKEQKYWAWGNKKHVHYFTPETWEAYLSHEDHICGIERYLVTDGYDLNASFYVIIEKK